MYQPRLQEYVWLDAYMFSNALNNLLSQSTVGWVDLNIEADSDGRIPKGCKEIMIYVRVNDSGSAAGNPGITLRSQAASDKFYRNEIGGITNDALRTLPGRQTCDLYGDVDYYITATGAGTFDITSFRYFGVQI